MVLWGRSLDERQWSFNEFLHHHANGGALSTPHDAGDPAGAAPPLEV